MQNKKSPYHFGEKLRTVRERRGYTLKTVANQAGVSESLISQIERNKVSPAIDTLIAIANVLEINLEFLFEELRHNRPLKVVPAQGRRTLLEGDILYEELASSDLQSDSSHILESYLITIPVNSQTHKGSYGHLGQEMGFIIEGQGQLQYESKTYNLFKGDSISFSASAPHTLCNTGNVELKALWVVTPPQRFS